MNLDELNPKIRFSNRVDNYIKFRPNYPTQILDFLNKAIGLTSASIVADIGSGTGISSKLFLENGNIVFGIEPNTEMRQAAEEALAKYSNFRSINASSEDTKLQSQSIDIIVAAQAFHWFDPKPTKEEFLRILKPGGTVVLLANRKRRNEDKFMNRYMAIIEKYGQNLNLKTDTEVIPNFFYPNIVQKEVLYNPRLVDFDRLKGDLTSYSYMPDEQDPRYTSMVEELEVLFQNYNNDGKINFEYETVVYYSRLTD